jgi:hypothetical protein
MNSSSRNIELSSDVKSALDRIIETGLSSDKKIEVLVRRYLEQRIAESNSKIKDYENKYGCSYHEFKARFTNLERHTWEMESDLFDWGAAVTDLQVLEEAKARLAKEKDEVRVQKITQ